jgi:hypothetical protein
MYLIGGEEVMPVFTSEEEARLFLRSAPSRDAGWQIRPTTTGELVSILYGPCSAALGVALDPPPEAGDALTAGLVSISREVFIERILERRRVRRPDGLKTGRAS